MWNTACSVTNVPIVRGTRVVSLIGTDDRHGDPDLEVFPFHFRGVYDGAGNILADDMLSADLALETFSEQMAFNNYEIDSLDHLVEIVGDSTRVKGNASNKFEPLHTYLIIILETVWDELISAYEIVDHSNRVVSQPELIKNEIDDLINLELELSGKSPSQREGAVNILVLYDVLAGFLAVKTRLIGLVSVPKLLARYRTMFYSGNITPEDRAKYKDAVDNITQVIFVEMFMRGAFILFRKTEYWGQSNDTELLEFVCALAVKECEEFYQRTIDNK